MSITRPDSTRSYRNLKRLKVWLSSMINQFQAVYYAAYIDVKWWMRWDRKRNLRVAAVSIRSTTATRCWHCRCDCRWPVRWSESHGSRSIPAPATATPANSWRRPHRATRSAKTASPRCCPMRTNPYQIQSIFVFHHHK